jgi:ABC-type antimicrobial peptide transport system permease subunit
LVVGQFSISVALIIGTIVVIRQIQYAKSRPVGYRRDGLISVAINTPDISGHYNAIRKDLLQTGAIEDMAESSSPETEIETALTGFDWRGKDPHSNPLFGTIGVTHDFGRTIGWEVLRGRDFSRKFLSDSGASGSLILNEAAVKLTGLRTPVGELIKFNGVSHPIIGVVKDMLMESPYSPVSPTIFIVDYGWTNFITIRIKPSLPVHEALAKIEPVFKQYNPASPFEYRFIDEEYAKKFSDEQRIGNLAAVFAILAIFISCLGLFGLVSFVAEQRTKEIGVRKLLGASAFNIWNLITREFVFLVLISLLIAIPVAYLFMDKWLQNYQYRSDMSWWIFAAAGTAAIVITLLTVSFQSIKAALANPTSSLRSE